MKIRDIITKYSSSATRRVWILLLIASAMGMVDFASANIFSIALRPLIQFLCLLLSSAFKATVLTLFYILCRKNRWLKAVAVTILSIYTILCLINFICFEFYGFGVSHKMLTLVSETNPSEAKDFLQTLIQNCMEICSLNNVAMVALIIAIMYCLIKLPEKIFTPLALASSIIGCGTFIFLGINASYGKNNLSMLLRISKNAIEVYRENRQLSSMMQKLNGYENPENVDSDHKAFNIIVIFGESADMHHLSLYGYPLPTTPVLDSMSDSLFIFDDALASSKFTSDNMERMLTMKKDCDTDGWWNHPLIIDIMNAGGYDTYWLSNQEKSGIWSNATGVISSRSSKSKFIGKTSSEDYLLQKYDEELIPEIRDALRDSVNPKMIAIHLMGSHFAYGNRYPEDRQYFSASDIEKARPRDWMNSNKYQIAANYDNSIRYTDSITGIIFDLVSRQQKPSIVLYVSDHGEDVYDNGDYCGRNIRNVRVPFVIYANGAYREEYPEIIEALKSSTSKKIATANLPFTIMTLTGTHSPDYDATYDFLSPQYKTRIRFVENEPWPFE